ncbi:hypothetical protein GALL_61970 [mine drainage metagenome]|uniref:GTPase-associated system helical domain-containing protein n=1 Tax=mine drainage metagenome TaxID=410659 RepID=A0A1J5SVD7_9ZZZZ
MDNISVHMRISGVTVSDDDVNSRRSASTALAATWIKETNVSKLLSKAAEVAEALGGDGTPSPGLGIEIQKAIQKKSSSFLYEERPLEVSVCAGMAMVSILSGTLGSNGWTSSDVYAFALWSALAYQPVLESEKREKLRWEVLDLAAKRVTASAEKARGRVNVPDPTAVNITIDEANVTSNNFKEAIVDTIEALRRNAALDREELDFLWWAQLSRSRILNKQFSEIPEPTRIVAAGLEGAKILRRLPCEVHREIILRTIDQNPKLDLGELLAAVTDDREFLAAAIIDGTVIDHSTIFPLLHALTTGEVNLNGAVVKRHVSEWGERALLEAGFAKMKSQGLVKL